MKTRNAFLYVRKKDVEPVLVLGRSCVMGGVLKND